MLRDLEIWKDRIENEIKSLDNLKVVEKDSIIHDENFVEFVVNIKALGFVLKQDPEGIDLVTQKDHRIFLKLNRSFPYPGGVDFSFLTNIFHPNILEMF